MSAGRLKERGGNWTWEEGCRGLFQGDPETGPLKQRETTQESHAVRLEMGEGGVLGDGAGKGSSGQVVKDLECHQTQG